MIRCRSSPRKSLHTDAAVQNISSRKFTSRPIHLPDRLVGLLRTVVYLPLGDLFGPESHLFPLWAEYELGVSLLTLGRTCYLLGLCQ
jgi:hypothetical protein